MATYTKSEKRRFITILSDGRFHESVPIGTEGATIREYETSDGKKGQKNEIMHRTITAKITKVNFVAGDYGQMMELTLDDGAIISIGTALRYGTDILKRLPNVNFDEEVELMPWSMEDGDRKKTGCVVKQNGEKVESYFEAQAGDGKWIQKNGLPKPKPEQTKTQWRKYFMDVQAFLVEYASENICPKLNNAPQKLEDETEDEKPNDDDIASSIPF